MSYQEVLNIMMKGSRDPYIRNVTDLFNCTKHFKDCGLVNTTSVLGQLIDYLIEAKVIEHMSWG